MNIDDLLQSGSSVDGGRGLHERKAARNSRAKAIGNEIGDFARDHTLEEVAEEFGISLTATAKYLSRLIKKDASLPADLFLPSERVSEIESFIRAGNTTSIKRMITAANGRFSEAEIRIVKADIERRGAEDCAF